MTDFFIDDCLLPKQINFLKDFEKILTNFLKQKVFLLNEQFSGLKKNMVFFWKKDFIEKKNLLNNNFTEQLFSEKTNEFTNQSFKVRIPTEIDGKWTIILENEKINFFLNDLKDLQMAR